MNYDWDYSKKDARKIDRRGLKGSYNPKINSSFNPILDSSNKGRWNDKVSIQQSCMSIRRAVRRSKLVIVNYDHDDDDTTL